MLRKIEIHIWHVKIKVPEDFSITEVNVEFNLSDCLYIYNLHIIQYVIEFLQ